MTAVLLQAAGRLGWGIQSKQALYSDFSVSVVFLALHDQILPPFGMIMLVVSLPGHRADCTKMALVVDYKR